MPILFASIAFLVVMFTVYHVNGYLDRRFLRRGGHCVDCRDTGAPGVHEVSCRHCGRCLPGYF